METPCPHLHLYREWLQRSLGDAAPRGAVFRRWPSLAPAVRVHAVRERHRAAGHPARALYVIDEIRGLLDPYAHCVRDKSALREVNDQCVEITTPYLDRHDDCTQIYVRRDNRAFMSTDGGETIQDLRASGCDLKTSNRRDLASTLNGFGIRKDGNALLVGATSQDFSLRKHHLVQAILAVNDLFDLAVPVVASLFLEDVTAWLELYDIRFTPTGTFTGRSGYAHTFAFVVPASCRAPERLIRAVERPSRDLAASLAFTWVDTKKVRTAESRFYACLYDENRAPSTVIVDALRNYDIVPVFGVQGTTFVKSWRLEHRSDSAMAAISHLRACLS